MLKSKLKVNLIADSELIKLMCTSENLDLEKIWITKTLMMTKNKNLTIYNWLIEEDD